MGVDIGSSSIKVVQLRKEKEQAILETYGELAVGPYAGLSIGQVARLSEDKLIEMFKNLFKEAGVNAKNGAVSVSLKNSFLTMVKLPKAKGKAMEEVVKYEARKYIPVSPEEIEMDWWILPPVEKKRTEEDDDEAVEEEEEEKIKTREMVDVLLVAVNKEILKKYRGIVSQAGLKSVRFEIEIFSILRSTLSRQTAPIMIIDMGASTTKASIINNGILRTSHSIDKGAQDLTNAIARSLTISFERAEDLKYEVGISARPEHKDLTSVMEPALNVIFSEAKQLMLDYRRKNNEFVGRVILTGGGSLLKNILDMAVKNFGVEVSLADPFARVNYPPFLQGVLKEMGPTFSTAMGLALMGL